MPLERQKPVNPNFNHVAPNPPFEFIRRRQKAGPQVSVAFDDLTIKVPNGERTLIEKASLRVEQGNRVSLTGPNGGGKSSLFRVARGVNHTGSGAVTLTIPEDKDVFVASQEIRRVPTTLPGLLAYKYAPEKYDREQYETAMQDAGLDEFLVHLPWRAVEPENMRRLLKPLLDEVLQPYAGVVSPAAATDFLKAFRKTLERKLEMPTALEEVYTPEIQDSIIEALCAHAKDVLDADPQKEQILMLRSSGSGRKAASVLCENAMAKIDSWLLQGQRMVLSGGEQQRMIFARAFLQAEDISLLLLDEPTSALKEDAAEDLLGKLFDKIPDCTVIAIIHTPALMKFFTHHMQLGEDKSLTLAPLAGDFTVALDDHSIASP